MRSLMMISGGFFFRQRLSVKTCHQKYLSSLFLQLATVYHNGHYLRHIKQQSYISCSHNLTIYIRQWLCDLVLINKRDINGHFINTTNSYSDV